MTYMYIYQRNVQIFESSEVKAGNNRRIEDSEINDDGKSNIMGTGQNTYSIFVKCLISGFPHFLK